VREGVGLLAAGGKKWGLDTEGDRIVGVFEALKSKRIREETNEI